MISSYQEHKRFLIMNIVNHLGSVSRTELAALSGYQLSNIGKLTKQLLEEDVLVETGSYSSGHGRKRILLELNKEHLCAVSISFSSTVVTFTVAQMGGTVLCTKQIDFSQNLSEASLWLSIRKTIHALLETYKDRNIIGIGICTPSNDPGSYPIAVLGSEYPRLGYWIQQVLLPRLSQEVSVPVHLFYDVTLAILAEQSFGLAKGVDDFICVELSNGLSCSICCNGKPVSGTTGIAGELGHTIVDMSRQEESICYCGKLGCVETNASLPELRQNIFAATKHNMNRKLSKNYPTSSAISLQDIREAIEADDLICKHYVKQAARRIGIAVSNAVTLLNPKLVILFGQMLDLGDYFFSNLKDTIQENVVNKQSFDIVVSTELEELLPLGAISALFSLYLKKDDFNWVYQLPISSDEILAN